MAFRYEKEQGGNQAIVIDGFEKGIASSPYTGIANIRNLDTTYYPGAAYVNYSRQDTRQEIGQFTLTGSLSIGATSATLSSNWAFASGTYQVEFLPTGVDSRITTFTNGSASITWATPLTATCNGNIVVFVTAVGGTNSMTNPVGKAMSPQGIMYVLDDSGQVWKSGNVSNPFTLLYNGGGRVGNGSGGIAYWNNYIVVFGGGLIEFCGDGTGDAGIVPSNWNLVNGFGVRTATAVFSTSPSQFIISSVNPIVATLSVGDPVTFTTPGTLPAPLVAGTTYYITSVTPGATYTYQVSLTVGGSNIVFTTTGSGTITLHDNASILPLGNVTSIDFSVNLPPPFQTATLLHYTDTRGVVVAGSWQSATGDYALINPNGVKYFVTLTNGSAVMTFRAPVARFVIGSYSAWLIDPSVTNYTPYVSKLDGNLYFSNGQYLGVIEAFNSNTVFNPGDPLSYTVNYGITSISQPSDVITGIAELNSNLVLTGNFDIYTWDFVSSNVNTSNPVGEQVVKVINILNNLYILAGTKGNIYVSNGYSSQLYYKVPDSLSGTIDPVWHFGDVMVHRSKMWFQATCSTNAGTNVLAGIFSLIVSKQALGENASGFVFESQNSYGLIPAAGAKTTGALFDYEAFSTSGVDTYFSAWSNGASIGGTDYNTNIPWQTFEAVIESDLIPIGDLVGNQKHAFGNVEFKLDRPMVSGDRIRLSWRDSLTASYTVMGTSTTNVLSEYFQSNINQAQWIQMKAELDCGFPSSFLPLREIRLHLA